MPGPIRTSSCPAACVVEVQRRYRLGRDAGERARQPACARRRLPGRREEEQRKAVGMVRHDRLAGDIVCQGARVKDVLPTFGCRDER